LLFGVAVLHFADQGPHEVERRVDDARRLLVEHELEIGAHQFVLGELRFQHDGLFVGHERQDAALSTRMGVTKHHLRVRLFAHVLLVFDQIRRSFLRAPLFEHLCGRLRLRTMLRCNHRQVVARRKVVRALAAEDEDHQGRESDDRRHTRRDLRGRPPLGHRARDCRSNGFPEALGNQRRNLPQPRLAVGRKRRRFSVEDLIDPRDVLGRVRDSVFPVLLEPFSYQRFDALWHARTGCDLAERRHLSRGVHAQERHHLFCLERRHTADHLVQHDRQRIDVRTRIDRLAERLLGRDIGGRADRDTELRQSWVITRQVRTIKELRDSEIEDLGEVGVLILLDEDDILRLHIAVNDAGVVRAHQCAQYMACDV